MDLHARIMNLRGEVEPDWTSSERGCYKIGHRDARHAAAELAAEQQQAMHLARSRIRELEEALRAIVDSLSAQDDEGLLEHAEPMQRARAALNYKFVPKPCCGFPLGGPCPGCPDPEQQGAGK